MSTSRAARDRIHDSVDRSARKAKAQQAIRDLIAGERWPEINLIVSNAITHGLVDAQMIACCGLPWKRGDRVSWLGARGILMRYDEGWPRIKFDGSGNEHTVRPSEVEAVW